MFGSTQIPDDFTFFFLIETPMIQRLSFFCPRQEPVCSDLARLFLLAHPYRWHFWLLQNRYCCLCFPIFMQLQLLWWADILKYFAFYLKSNSIVEGVVVSQKGCALQLCMFLQLNLSLRNKQINQDLLFYVKQRPRASFSLLSQTEHAADSQFQSPSITSSVFKLRVNCQ